jgi:hypothetical protein
LLLRLRGGWRFAFAPELAFAGTGVPLRLALVFTGRLVFRFAFPLSFEFLLGVGFFFGLSFALLLLFVFPRSVFVFAFVFAFALAFALAFAGGVLSPLLLARLISTATVWPTFTISPACGS